MLNACGFFIHPLNKIPYLLKEIRKKGGSGTRIVSSIHTSILQKIMKNSLGLFGKVILVGMIAAILLQIISPSNGVLKLIPKAKATYKSDTANDIVTDITTHEKPEFSGDTSSVKLVVGKKYDLLDLNKWGIQVKYEGTTPLEVEITEITDQWDKKIDTAKASAFVPQKAGVYYVTYRAFCEYQGTVLETSKQYTFSAY